MHEVRKGKEDVASFGRVAEMLSDKVASSSLGANEKQEAAQLLKEFQAFSESALEKVCTIEKVIEDNKELFNSCPRVIVGEKGPVK